MQIIANSLAIAFPCAIVAVLQEATNPHRTNKMDTITDAAATILAESFNKGLRTLEQVFAATDLAAGIERTNNRYLFNPSAEEIALALEFPMVFAVTRTTAKDFPNRIALRH